MRTVPAGRAISTNPFWSRDGARIYFHRLAQGQPKWRLRSMRRQGSGAVQLTHNPRAASEMVSR